MTYHRKSDERGYADHGWLQTHYTFSFADYHDKKHMGFGPLRVINEDFIQGGMGFGSHGHKNMEIISYIVEGALRHKDSMGNEAIIQPGDIQRMSAGTGVLHSEFNPLQNKKTHLLQIWILPDKQNIDPSYEQKSFTKAFASNDLVLVASPSGEQGTVSLNQDVYMYVAQSAAENQKQIKLMSHRHIWIQVIKGKISANENTLHARDGLGLTGVNLLHLKWSSESEFIVFDMP